MYFLSFKLNQKNRTLDYTTDNNIELFSLLSQQVYRIERGDVEKYITVIDLSTFSEGESYDLIFKTLETEVKENYHFNLIYEDLINKKTCLIFFFRENIDYNNEFFSKIDKLVNRIKISKKQLHFTSLGYYYDGFSNKQYQILHTPYYAFNTCWWSSDRAKRLIDFYRFYNEYSKTFLRQKHFVCTNNRIRHFRTWTLWSLFKNNLLDNGYVSYLANSNDSDNKYKFEEFLLDMKHSLGEDSQYEFSTDEFNKLESFFNLLPIECDTKQKMNISNHQSGMAIQGVLLNSYLNIITESHADYVKNERQSIFITEKTWKPILAHQPFIVIGQQKHLYALKKLGFKTFEKYIDESYDEKIGIEKYKTIEKEIVRICNMKKDDLDLMYWDMMDTLKHNGDNFLQMFENYMKFTDNFINEAWNTI